MIDITIVVDAIKTFFSDIYNWLLLHGIRIGTYTFSFFSLGISLAVLSVIVWTFIPWVNDDDGESGSWYDNDDD